MAIDVAIASPLTTEVILGFNFLREHRVLIDIPQKQLFKQPLEEPSPVPLVTKVKIHTARTTKIPPCREMDMMASLEQEVGEGIWLLEGSAERAYLMLWREP